MLPARKCRLFFVLACVVATAKADDEYADLSSYSPCRCESTFPCYCVQDFLCTSDGTISTTGEYVISPRSGGKLRRCPDEEICCALVDNGIPEMVTPRGSPKFTWPKCGHRKHWPRVDYVAYDTKPGEFSWMAAILTHNRTTGELLFQCGASIVGQRQVLTAGHCIHDLAVEDIVIRVGAWDLSNKTEDFEDYNVGLIIHHPSYSFDPPLNDVALLETSTEIRPGERVTSVCIPEKNMSFSGRKCTATGWGTGKINIQGQPRGKLRRYDLSIVPHDKCEKQYRNTHLGRFFILDQSFLCAGRRSADVCSGDGGGPLVCELNGMYFQVGVVSWGIGCNRRMPGVYANVALISKWIRQYMN